MATTLVTKGVVCGVSKSPEATLSSPISRALYSAAKKALAEYYVLRPVGSDTNASLSDRIALSYTEYLGATWQGAITADAVANDDNFQAWVSNCSPLSQRRSFAEVKALRTKRIVLVAVGAVIGVVVFAKFLSGGRQKAPSATHLAYTDSVVPALPEPVALRALPPPKGEK